MPIRIRCAECQHEFTVEDACQGRNVTCPGCGEQLRAPSAERLALRSELFLLDEREPIPATSGSSGPRAPPATENAPRANASPPEADGPQPRTDTPNVEWSAREPGRLGADDKPARVAPASSAMGPGAANAGKVLPPRGSAAHRRLAEELARESARFQAREAGTSPEALQPAGTLRRPMPSDSPKQRPAPQRAAPARTKTAETQPDTQAATGKPSTGTTSAKPPAKAVLPSGEETPAATLPAAVPEFELRLEPLPRPASAAASLPEETETAAPGPSRRLMQAVSAALLVGIALAMISGLESAWFVFSQRAPLSLHELVGRIVAQLPATPASANTPRPAARLALVAFLVALALRLILSVRLLQVAYHDEGDSTGAQGAHGHPTPGLLFFTLALGTVIGLLGWAAHEAATGGGTLLTAQVAIVLFASAIWTLLLQGTGRVRLGRLSWGWIANDVVCAAALTYALARGVPVTRYDLCSATAILGLVNVTIALTLGTGLVSGERRHRWPQTAFLAAGLLLTALVALRLGGFV